MTILLILLFSCIIAINLSYKLAVCSLMLVLSITIANLIAEFYGKQKAIGAVITLCLLTTILNWKNLNSLYLVSYFGICIAASVSLSLVKSLRLRQQSFAISNFISIIAASFIDTSICCIGLLRVFSSDKVLSIFIKDFMFKISYATTITICIYLLLAVVAYIKPVALVGHKKVS